MERIVDLDRAADVLACQAVLRRPCGVVFGPVTWRDAKAPWPQPLETDRARVGEARLHLRPRRADGGLWQVDVSVTVRGRWLLRPVVAVALAVVRRRARQEFGAAVERAADGWNKEIGELPALDPDEFRAELTKQAVERPPE
ncbi:hypothetical protein ACWCXX_09975 [Streptomyces sp. NPDC001732]